MRKVLVTGSAGFIGSHLVDALQRGECFVVGVDDLSGGDNICGNLSFKESILSRNLGRLFEGVDTVFHCAALAYEGLSVFSPRMVAENIVEGTVNVAVAAINAGVRLFINCSSMARYGNTRPPFSENVTPKPVDPYGLSKWAAEGLLNCLGEQHGMRVIHAVPHNVIGPRQKYDDPYRNVVSIMANRMLQGKPPIIYGDGEQQRCFSHVDDVLPVMVKMMDCPCPHGEVFNVGPDYNDTDTINIVAAILQELTGCKEKPIHVLPRPREVKYAYCSSEKIRRWFGFKQQVSLIDAIKSVVDWIREKGPKPFDYRLPLEIVKGAPQTWKERMI